MLKANEFMMPSYIKSELDDILLLIELFNEIIRSKQDVFYLNYSNTKFFASELYCLYHHYIKELKKMGIIVKGINVPEDVDYVNHLSGKYYDREDLKPNHNSVICPHDFLDELNRDDIDSFDKYVWNEFLPKVDFDDIICTVVIPYLSELFVNSRTHGNTHNISCAGQIYSLKDKIKFIIVDFGVTIPYNIENYMIKGKYHYFHENDGGAISWSTKEGTSTKKSLGGLGLNSIREFIDKNNGRLLIVSRFGSYERRDSKDRIANSNTRFDGTLVVVELNIEELKNIKKPVKQREIFSI